ncbi:unnamed protein product [Pelagomonas calceolata]|uniref:Uncharacterized protein n=1 Tax=Pelagomonas calceolata TaxID=35677 RepID=A0A8J2SRY2_9STRA|nr:unnamed protein product [Pelagomonas calceolata]
MRPEDRVELLRHADEGRALGQLPQRRGPDVGARRPDAAQEIEDDALHGPLRGHLDGLALAAPVLGDAAGVLRHGHRRGHAVEELDARPVGLDDLVARGLVRAGEQPAHHDEVRARAEGLGGVAGARDAAVAHDVAAEAVGRVGALDHGGDLGVAHAGLLARRADGPGPDAHLDDVGAVQDELLGHLVRDDVARHDRVRRPLGARLAHAVDEALGVAVRHVDADGRDLGAARQDRVDLGRVRRARAHAHGDVPGRGRRLGHERPPRLDGVVLVDRDEAPVLAEGLGHLERADRVHVRDHDRHAGQRAAAVLERDRALHAHLLPAPERRALRPDEHVLEVELRVLLDAHALGPSGSSAAVEGDTGEDGGSGRAPDPCGVA